jgi:VCBS repeat-containing protein
MEPKAGGAPVTMKGRFAEVSVEKDGKWVYLVDHASAEPPPAPAKQ